MPKSKKSATPSGGKSSAHAAKSAGPAKRPPTVRPLLSAPIRKAKGPAQPEAKATKAEGKASAAPKTAPAEGTGAAPSARKWPKGGPSKADVRRYRERLLAMRRALLSSSTELAQEALQSSGGEFSVDHMADYGSDNYEQDFNLKLLEGESAQLTEIRDALLKIDGKADLPFGICEACADDAQHLCETCPWIPASRLDVIPYARLCVQTKQQEERKTR